MNLKEALDSGRPWKRKLSGPIWFNSIVDRVGGARVISEDGVEFQLCAADIKADDYETKPAQVTITEAQLLCAYEAAANTLGIYASSSLYHLMVEALGFREVMK